MGTVPFQVTVFGAGQVGRALAKAARAHAIHCHLYGFRRGLPRALPPTDLLLICVRDGQIHAVVDALRRRALGPRMVIAHVSGLLGPEVLQPLAPQVLGVGQLHPFCSIRSFGHFRHFKGVHFLGSGTSSTKKTLKKLVRRLGGKFVDGDSIERTRYHLAAALLANGSVALMHAAARLLESSGIPRKLAPKMLLELERSVLCNLERVGIQAALTGPVRRGDTGTIRRHLEQCQRVDTTTNDLYRSLVLSQLEIAKELGELEPTLIRKLKRLAVTT